MKGHSVVVSITCGACGKVVPVAEWGESKCREKTCVPYEGPLFWGAAGVCVPPRPPK